MAQSNSSATASSGGIGFLGLLTIVLVILKATGYLAVSWWVCFLPVIIGIALTLLVFLIFFLILAISD